VADRQISARPARHQHRGDGLGTAHRARHRRRLLDDPQQIAGALREYVAAFSPGAAETLQKFNFDEQITRLDEADLL